MKVNSNNRDEDDSVSPLEHRNNEEILEEAIAMVGVVQAREKETWNLKTSEQWPKWRSRGAALVVDPGWGEPP